MSRDVVVRLSANTAGYVSGMARADAATAKTEAGMSRLNKKTLSTDQVMGKVGKVGGRLFLGAAAGIAVAEKKAADFNAQMATVYTLSHANTRQQDLLAKAAKSVGVNIGYSATASAAAEEELIKAGVKLKDILGGGLKGALDLAAAGQTDVGTATEVAASAMTQFRLKGKDVPHIADLLAAGADKALGSVTDLGYGLSQAGTTAHQMGLSIEDTTGTLAEFAQNGLIGERGGTTFKMMLLKLANPTAKAGELMDKYGLSIYKANGQMKTMPQIAGNLQKSFKDLDPAQRNAALGTIFGSRAIQAANILIKEGEQGNRKWIASVNDQGFAAHQAAGKMDSLKGDLSKLGAALDNAFINTAGDQGGLRGIVHEVTSLVKAYDHLSNAQKGLLPKAFLGAAAVGGALWTANKIYTAAKGTAALYRGLGGMLTRGAAASGGGAVGSAIGQRVAVTNWPPGLLAGGAGGAAGAGAGAAEGAAVAAASRGATAKMILGKVAITAASVVLAGQLAQGISSLLNTVLPRNPKEKTSDPLFKPFSQNIPGGGIPGALRNRDSLTTSVHTVAQSKGGGGIDGFGLRSSVNLGKLFTGGGWNAIGDDEKRVKTLDTAIANLTSKNKTRGQAEFNQVLAKTGLTAKEVAKALPKTAAALKANPADAAKSAKYWDTVSGGSRKAITTLAKYGKSLKTLPKEIRSAVYTPGVKDSIANIKDLARWYHLTPKQVKTAMLLNGYSETQARIVAAGRAFNRLPKQVKTALRADTVKSRFDVAALQRAYHLTPKQVATVFKVSGAQTVQQAAAAARAALASIPKTVYVDIQGRNHVQYGTANTSQHGLKQPIADGGTVMGQRYPYGDKVLAHLAPGEEVITNRRGEADRFRADRAAGRIPRYANGGTVPGAVSGGTGTRSVIVNFPAPAVYAAAVKAADQIAAAAVKTTATAQDLRGIHLDDLHLQQQIRDTTKSLNEHVKKNIKVKQKDKKGHVHTVTKSVTTKKFSVTGLDRTTAQAELADLKAQLVEQRKQNTVQKALADAKAEAVAAQKQARSDAQSTLTGGLDLLSHSAAGASTYVNKMAGDLAKAGTIMARLRGAKVSPVLLQQILDHVNSGDLRGAIRFGQALLDQPALMAQLNTSLGSFSQVAGGVATLSTDPRFLGTTAWNPTGQVASAKVVQVQLGVDPSAWTTDITRRVTANVLNLMNGGG